MLSLGMQEVGEWGGGGGVKTIRGEKVRFILNPPTSNDTLYISTPIIGVFDEICSFVPPILIRA